MSSADNDGKQRALAREWLAARIVVIGGLVLAVAVAGYFAYQQHEAAVQVQQAAIPKKIDFKALRRIETAVCTAEVVRAIDIGVVPAYAQLATWQLAKTPQGHYLCEAKTRVTTYLIAADLLCNDLKKADCVSIYRILLKDGRFVYARPQ